MKYQLADLNNGPFGDVYDTITDAEAALAEIVKDSLAQAKEEILLQEDEDAERECREPKVFDDEELAEKAEERIREFHSIVEINYEAEAEAEAEHRSASIIQRQRSGRFVDAEDVEEWKVWEDGARDDAVRFIVPAGGVVDIAEAGAAALGVDVSERLNVARV